MAEPSMSEVVRAMELWVDSFAFSSSAPSQRSKARAWAWLSSYADERAIDALLPPEDPPRPAEGEPGATPGGPA